MQILRFRLALACSWLCSRRDFWSFVRGVELGEEEEERDFAVGSGGEGLGEAEGDRKGDWGEEEGEEEERFFKRFAGWKRSIIVLEEAISQPLAEARAHKRNRGGGEKVGNWKSFLFGLGGKLDFMMF